MSANDDLVEAAETGDIEKVKKAIKEGANVNVHSQSIWAPIIHAASNGHLEVVKYLIEHGADMKNYLRKLGAKP